MTNYSESALNKYLKELASVKPAPGGGSASALVGAAGAACLEMAAVFTINKKGYERVQKEIKRILKKLSSARRNLLFLIDKDVSVYAEVSAAFGLPKNTEKEIKRRRAKIQETLKNALSVPLKIMEVSASVLPPAERLMAICNKNLITDVGCGASFLRAAIESAKLNVDINLKYIKDRSAVKKSGAAAKTFLKTAGTAEKILSEISEILT